MTTIVIKRLVYPKRIDLSAFIPIAKRLAIGSAVSLIIIMSIITAWQHPAYDFDIIPYSALAVGLEGGSAQSIQVRTYQLLRDAVPSDIYKEMTSGSIALTKDIAADYHSFIQQLPFYWLKPLYVALMYAFLKLGINPMVGSQFLSLAAGLFILLFLYRWLRTFASVGLSVLSGSLLLLAAGYFDLVGQMGPDLLSSALIFAVFYTSFVKKEEYLVPWVLMAAVLMRSDNIILVILWMAYNQFYSETPLKKKWAILFLVVNIAMVEIISIASHFYGWSTLFYHTFYGYLSYPAEYHSHITISQYLNTLLHSFRVKPPANSIAFFLLLASMGQILRREGALPSAYVTIALLSVLIHYLLFPGIYPRFFFAYYLLTGIFFLERVTTMQRSFAARPEKQQALQSQNSIFALN